MTKSYGAALGYDADDLIQEFTVYLLQKLGAKYDPSQSNPVTFLRARFQWFVRDYARRRQNNIVLNWRSRSGLETRGEAYVDCPVPCDSMAIEWADLLAMLPTPAAAIIDLRYRYDCEMAEIALRVGRTLHRVRVLHRAALRRIHRAISAPKEIAELARRRPA